MEFIHLLNESAIVYVPDRAKYNWQYFTGMKDGYEAYSVFGEIRIFDTWHDANNWRITEIRKVMECHNQFD